VRIFRRVLQSFNNSDDSSGMEVDAYVVLGASHVVILDTLLCPADMAFVMAVIEPELGNRQVLCVNSHADWDHCWGNSYFKHTRRAPILAHEECRQRLLSSEASTELYDYKKKSALFAGVTLVPPTLTFREQLMIADESMSIELLYAPGHCRDHIVAWLPALSLLLAFDTVEKPLPCIEESACTPLMFSTLRRLAALNAQHVLCSHGSNASPALLHENLAYLEEIERRARLFLQKHTPTATELEQAATLINYPFDEVVVSLTESFDRTFYSQAHEQNVQAILRWRMEETS